MGKNVGKKFEEQIINSLPDYVLSYRLPDSAQSFGSNEKLRFSRKSPFDYLLWDSHKHILYALEMKTVNGKSISFERTKEESREIHYHQIEGLNHWNTFDGVVCGFVIEFREIETTVFIDIENFNNLISQIEKKSFNYNDLKNSGFPYIVIPQRKKRTRYIYDIEKLLKKY